MAIPAVSLLCDSCHIAFVSAEEGRRLVCPGCGKAISCAGGIIDLVSGSAQTALDDIDYDSMYAVSVERSREQFREIRDTLGEHLPAKVERMLEVGAGTGGFTIGLLDNVAVEAAVISDISPKMLAICKRRVETYLPQNQMAQYITHSGTENCFAGETFDLVIGSFVLHHILDFDNTLKQVHDWLIPGGRAIFLEPNGTAMRAMVMTFCEVIHYFADQPAFADDLWRLISWVGGINHGLVYSGEREVLAHQEDKHFFSRPQLDLAARVAGFGDINIVPYGLPDCGGNAAWTYLGQLGLSDEGRAAFFRCFQAVAPRIYALVGERDGAASYAIILKKTPQTCAVTARRLPEVTDYAVEHSTGHVTVSVEYTVDGSSIYIAGWVVGLDIVKFIDIYIDGKAYKVTVGRSRTDVMRVLESRFPLQNSLYSGLEMRQSLLDDPPQLNSEVMLRVCFSAGGIRTLPAKAFDDDRCCEFMF